MTGQDVLKELSKQCMKYTELKKQIAELEKQLKASNNEAELLRDIITKTFQDLNMTSYGVGDATFAVKTVYKCSPNKGAGPEIAEWLHSCGLLDAVKHDDSLKVPFSPDVDEKLKAVGIQSLHDVQFNTISLKSVIVHGIEDGLITYDSVPACVHLFREEQVDVK